MITKQTHRIRNPKRLQVGMFLGKENGNVPDSILLVLICLYITWILGENNVT